MFKSCDHEAKWRQLNGVGHAQFWGTLTFDDKLPVTRNFPIGRWRSGSPQQAMLAGVLNSEICPFRRLGLNYFKKATLHRYPTFQCTCYTTVRLSSLYTKAHSKVCGNDNGIHSPITYLIELLKSFGLFCIDVRLYAGFPSSYELPMPNWQAPESQEYSWKDITGLNKIALLTFSCIVITNQAYATKCHWEILNCASTT